MPASVVLLFDLQTAPAVLQRLLAFAGNLKAWTPSSPVAAELRSRQDCLYRVLLDPSSTLHSRLVQLLSHPDQDVRAHVAHVLLWGPVWRLAGDSLPQGDQHRHLKARGHRGTPFGFSPGVAVTRLHPTQKLAEPRKTGRPFWRTHPFKSSLFCSCWEPVKETSWSAHIKSSFLSASCLQHVVKQQVSFLLFNENIQSHCQIGDSDCCLEFSQNMNNVSGKAEVLLQHLLQLLEYNDFGYL